MPPTDRAFFAILCLALLMTGSASTLVFRVTTAAPPPSSLTGRTRENVEMGPEERYRGLLGQSRESLAAEERADRREAFRRRIEPTAKLRDWRGVLHVVAVEPEGFDPERYLESFAHRPDMEEGAPFHFLVTKSGQVSATERWKKQRTVPLAAAPGGNDWIVVLDHGTAAPETEAAMLDGLLAMPPFSRGERARAAGLDADIVLESEVQK